MEISLDGLLRLFAVVSTTVEILAVAAVGLIIYKVRQKNNENHLEYDERQRIIKGKSYTLGFFAIAACELVLIDISLAGFTLPVAPYITHLCVLLLGGMVVFSHSLWKGAYFGIKSSKQWLWLFIVFLFLGAANIHFAVLRIKNGVTSGFPDAEKINLICGVCFILLSLQALIKIAIDGRAEKAGDDE